MICLSERGKANVASASTATGFKGLLEPAEAWLEIARILVVEGEGTERYEVVTATTMLIEVLPTAPFSAADTVAAEPRSHTTY